MFRSTFFIAVLLLSANALPQYFIPGQGYVLPGQGYVLPGQGYVLPGQGNVLSGQGNVLSGQGIGSLPIFLNSK